MIELLLLLAAVAAAGGGKSPPLLVAEPWTGGGATPVPPTSGNAFREGAQPDPSAPDDPGRGRYFAVLGQGRQAGYGAEHALPVVRIAANAKGKITVTIWAQRKGHPDRCTRWGSTIEVDDGRIKYPQGWSFATTCGAKPVNNTAGDGCTMPLPKLAWEQQGPDLVLLWSTKIDGKQSTDNDDCNEHLGFLVDVFWRFE